MSKNQLTEVRDRLDDLTGMLFLAAEDLAAFTKELQHHRQEVTNLHTSDCKSDKPLHLGAYGPNNNSKVINLSNLIYYINENVQRATQELDTLYAQVHESLNLSIEKRN